MKQRVWILNFFLQFAKHNGVEVIIDHILRTDNLTLQVQSIILACFLYGRLSFYAPQLPLPLLNIFFPPLYFDFRCISRFKFISWKFLYLLLILCISMYLQELTALFQPFGVCDDYINANYFKVVFKECVLYGIHFVENMPEADMKNKVIKTVMHTTLHYIA